MKTILLQSNRASLLKGGQRSISYLLRDIDRTSFAPVLTCQVEGDLTEMARRLSVPVEIIRLPRLRLWNFTAVVRALGAYSRMIMKYRLSIAHCEELTAVALLWMAKTLCCRKLRLIWHVRVAGTSAFHAWLATRLCDAVICVSQPVCGGFPASPKLHQVNNGIDPDEYDPARVRPLRSDRFPGTATVIGYMGALSYKKGAPILLEALPAIVSRYPEAICVFAGTGDPEFEKWIRRRAEELSLSGKVVFWGGAGGEAVQLMRRFDLFVFPSFSEGMSRSLLEAMALSRPIVASDIPQNAQLIVPHATGLLARTNDPGDTADKIMALLADKQLRAALGEKARASVIANYTHAMTMRKIQDIYRSLT